MNPFLLLLIGLLNGAAIGVFFYFAKASKADSKTLFDPLKLFRTVIVSAILSGGALFMGYELNLTNWQNYAAANTGLIVTGDQLTKMLWRYGAKYFGKGY